MSLTFVDRLNEWPLVLVDLLRDYAVLTPIRSLVFPSSLAFDVVHGFLLNNILFHPLFVTYPPSLQYQAAFWKWALDNLEKLADSEDCEIDAQMYEHYVSLIPTSSSQTVGVQPPVPSYVTYFWKNNFAYRSATLLESRTTIESGTTGLTTWLASLVLAEYLVANSELVRGARVLELGCGVGLLGIIVATLQLSPTYVGGNLYLSDVNPEVLRRCASNVSLPCNLSCAHPALACMPLDWADALDDERVSAFRSSLQKISPDIIIGADVMYDPVNINPLVRSIYLGLQCKPSAMALIAITVRNEDTMTQFIHAAEEHLTVCDLNPELVNAQDIWGTGHYYDVNYPHTIKTFSFKSNAVR